MATTEVTLMTADGFYVWANRPENRHARCELERGEVLEMSRREKRHGLICANAVRILGNFTAQQKKGYVCSNDTGVIVEREPDTVRGPDIMLFDDAESIEEVSERFGELPPLLAVEVLSPSDTMGKVLRRVREQVRFGTKIVWVVDPDARNVIVHRTGIEPTIHEQSDELTGEEVLPRFRCRVANLFRLPGKP